MNTADWLGFEGLFLSSLLSLFCRELLWIWFWVLGFWGLWDRGCWGIRMAEF